MSSRLALSAAMILVVCMATAALTDDPPTDPTVDRTVDAPADARLDWWREARFGLFIHWGLYAIPAGEWKGSTNHAEWIRTTARIPLDEYDALRDGFDPVKFDADAWARMAKDAGMKYIVITSKHHDGFCLFDSKHTDFDVMSTPFQRDIMQELADACRRHGLRLCWYHSIMDWRHPDYLPRRTWEADRPVGDADFDRFRRYLHGQVEELLTNYGDIGVMWFDGEWESTWTHEHGKALYELCRRLQPDVIVNNRVDKGRAGMAGLTTDARYFGDFGTPEQEVPSTGLPGVDWESCITMNGHWGYNRHDDDWKSATELIRMLVDIASKGGNLLLNVGPTAEGEFPAESVERLAAIGRWMGVNGASIHGTTASPFRSLAWGRCTVGPARAADGDGDTRLYLHVFDWPSNGSLTLPGLGNTVRRAYLLADSDQRVAARRSGTDVRLTLPSIGPDEHCPVVVVEIEGQPVVYEKPRITAASDILVRPLAVELSAGSPDLVVRYTLDGSEPGPHSRRYHPGQPILLAETTLLRARVYHHGRPVSGIAERRFTRVTPLASVQVAATTHGLACETFAGTWSELPDFDALTPVKITAVANFDLPPGPSAEHVGRRYRGYIDVPRDDVYLFTLNADDGARLLIGNRLVVDNDGLHGPRELAGTIALGRGFHPITVEHFNRTGGAELHVAFGPAGEPPRRIAGERLASPAPPERPASRAPRITPISG